MKFEQQVVVDFRELPTEDDPSAEEFYRQRHVGRRYTIVPCRWGLLDNSKTRQDVRDLVISTLAGLQSLAAVYFGGKFIYLFDYYGWPRVEWDLNFSDGTVDGKLAVVAPVCKLAMYFMRTFGRLLARFGRSEAVNLVDGIVSGLYGVADLVSMLLKHLMQRDNVSVANLNDHVLVAQAVILGENEVLMERDVVLRASRDLQANDLSLSEIEFRRPSKIKLDSRPLKMVKLALEGYLWNTDGESSSLLRAVCNKPRRTIGKWEPLSRFERNQLFDALDADGHFHVVGTDVWVRRIWGRHALVRREAFYERIQPKCTPTLGYGCLLTHEQAAISSRVVELLSWLRDRPQEWAEDLFNDLHQLKCEGYNAESEVVSRAIQAARTRASQRHRNDDEIFDVLFGFIFTSYSFACESTDFTSFARLHYRRCLRIIGIHSTIDGIPLYALEPKHQLDERVSSIVREASELEPILNDLRNKPTPQLYKPWKTELMW